MTIRDAARRLGVHESTVRRYADRGLIGVSRLPSGVRRLRRADVEGLAASGESSSTRAMAPSASEPADVWRSDAELAEFLELTYAERDRDR